MGSPLNFVIWNVKGLNHPVRRKKISTHLKWLKTDFAFLQETSVRSSDNSKFMAERAFTPPSRQRQGGVSILIANNILFEPSNIAADKNGKFIIVSGKLFNP